MFVADDTTYLLLHSVRPVHLQEAGHGSQAGRGPGEIIAAGALWTIAVEALLSLPA
jgi:hypothetical protein